MKCVQNDLLTVLHGRVSTVSATDSCKNLNAFSVDIQKTMQKVLAETKKRLLANSGSGKYSWDDYMTLLNELSDTNRYLVLPGRDVIKTQAPDKVVIYMRHDIDHDPQTALRMAEAENKLGMQSSYYVLNTAPYYGEQTPTGVKRYASMDKLYLDIQKLGHEVGVHNDLLSAMILWDADPIVLQGQELDYYRSIGLNVTGVVSHGAGIVLKRNLNNTWVFSEFGKTGSFIEDGRLYEYGKYSISDFGFDYEGYRLTSKRGGSDIGAGTFQEKFLDQLKNLVPGDRATILTHPIYWGNKE